MFSELHQTCELMTTVEGSSLFAIWLANNDKGIKVDLQSLHSRFMQMSTF